LNLKGRDQQGHKEAIMVSLTTADYEQFETGLKSARRLVIRAVQELAAIVAIAAAGAKPGDDGGIIHVATLTDPGSEPPHLCKTVLELITEGLRSSLITEAEMSLEDRNKAYYHLLDFMLSLKPITVNGINLLEGDTEGALIALKDLLAPLPEYGDSDY
jgi:hypothetical protein